MASRLPGIFDRAASVTILLDVEARNYFVYDTNVDLEELKWIAEDLGGGD
jgi:hypothetical protein